MCAAFALASCGGGGGNQSSATGSSPQTGTSTPAPPIRDLTTTAVTNFAAPWSMAFLPDGRLLVTERVTDGYDPGKLWVTTQAGQSTAVDGLPTNVGMLDVILSPNYRTDKTIFFSFLEPGGPDEPRVGRDAADTTIIPAGLAVASATLAASGGAAQLTNVRVIWRQAPKIVSNPGSGEPGGRITFSPDARYLFIAAGDRQEFAPVQDLGTTLGKIVRIFPDGTIPPDNPFVGRSGARPEIWTLGHRNPYGLVFAADGRLFESEMGPMGGDEFNLIVAGRNYGWPNVSEGDNYDGTPIPRHASNPSYAAPLYSWTPVIAPGGMIQYRGTRFSGWDGDFVLAGLVQQGLVRVRVTGTTAAQIERIGLGARIREVEEGPDGALWVLEDGTGGRLLRIDPAFML